VENLFPFTALARIVIESGEDVGPAGNGTAGNPPATILASAVKSGLTPTFCCKPPAETRKPVTTSSKINTTSLRVVQSRS
jgi:hypothetical protein